MGSRLDVKGIFVQRDGLKMRVARTVRRERLYQGASRPGSFSSIVLDIDDKLVVPLECEIQIVIAQQARSLPTCLVLVEQSNFLALWNL